MFPLKRRRSLRGENSCRLYLSDNGVSTYQRPSHNGRNCYYGGRLKEFDSLCQENRSFARAKRADLIRARCEESNLVSCPRTRNRISSSRSPEQPRSELTRASLRRAYLPSGNRNPRRTTGDPGENDGFPK